MSANGWLPIETAPRDGTRVMLHVPNDGPVFGRWNDNQFARKPKPFWDHDRTLVDGMTYSRKNPPNHWQPMPSPPELEPANG